MGLGNKEPEGEELGVEVREILPMLMADTQPVSMLRGRHHGEEGWDGMWDSDRRSDASFTENGEKDCCQYGRVSGPARFRLSKVEFSMMNKMALLPRTQI